MEGRGRKGGCTRCWGQVKDLWTKPRSSQWLFCMGSLYFYFMSSFNKSCLVVGQMVMWEGSEPLNSLSIRVLTLGKRSRRSLGKETPYLRSHHTLLQGCNWGQNGWVFQWVLSSSKDIWTIRGTLVSTQCQMALTCLTFVHNMPEVWN